MTTKATYAFSDGFDNPIIAIPFRYASKEHVCVLIDGVRLETGIYSFETAGTIRLHIKRKNPAIVTLQRITTLTESSLTAHIIMALEESRDAESEMRSKADAIMRSIAETISNVTNTFTEKLSEIKESAFIKANETLENAKLIAADIERTVAAAHALENEKRAALKKHTDERADVSEKRVEELWRLLDERTVFLSRAISAAFDNCRAETDNIRIDMAEISALPAAHQAQSAPVAMSTMQAPYENAQLTTLEDTLAQTRTALNGETQTRRREDAQIKALLKRLLEKHERIEDYIASNDENFPQSVLSEMRAESRMQDDKLGRILLANIARIETLKKTLRNED